MFALTFVHFLQQLPHWSHGVGYQWWSGIGSCLAYVTGLATILGLVWRHLNCHEPRCKRIGRFHVETPGQRWLVCKHHHPTGGIPHQNVRVDPRRGLVATLFEYHWRNRWK